MRQQYNDDGVAVFCHFQCILSPRFSEIVTAISLCLFYVIL